MAFGIQESEEIEVRGHQPGSLSDSGSGGKKLPSWRVQEAAHSGFAINSLAAS